MRIAFLTSQFPGIRMGGIGSNTLAIARGLADIGHDVHLFTFHLPPDLLAALPATITFHATPDLAQPIRSLARAYGHEANLASVRITPGEPFALMADPEKLETALLAACDRAIDHDGADAILIGGGPLSMAARTIAHKVRVPLVEPVPAAVRLACQRAGAVI